MDCQEAVVSATTKGLDEKFCCECGSVIKAKAEICVKCGCRQQGMFVSAPTFESARHLAASEGQWISGQPHPWRRYFARMLDNTTNGSIAFFFVGIIFYSLA